MVAAEKEGTLRHGWRDGPVVTALAASAEKSSSQHPCQTTYKYHLKDDQFPLLVSGYWHML